MTRSERTQIRSLVDTLITLIDFRDTIYEPTGYYPLDHYSNIAADVRRHQSRVATGLAATLPTEQSPALHAAVELLRSFYAYKMPVCGNYTQAIARALRELDALARKADRLCVDLYTLYPWATLDFDEDAVAFGDLSEAEL